MSGDARNGSDRGEAGEGRDEALDADARVGRYRVLEPLSGGLLLSYYLARDERDGSDVALGVFHPRTLRDTGLTRRLRQLHRRLEGVRDEAIPRMLDTGQTNERHYVVYEAIEGESLANYFAQAASPGGGCPEDSVTRIGASLLGAIGRAHESGVRHGDLHSEVVFVRSDLSVQVLGFGLKEALGTELFESIVSASVSPLVASVSEGTVNSFDALSPEHRRGASEDGRVDFYAAGVLAYWLLTGNHPGRKEMVRPSAIVDDAGRAWDAFLFKCLESDPDQRYQSAAGALHGLRSTERFGESEGANLIERQIERLPVPREVAARGAFASSVYRLSIIGVVGLTLVGFAAYFLQVAFTEPEAYEPRRALEAHDARPPDLVLRLSPPRARVQLVGYDDSFITSEGRLALNVMPGRYELRVSAPDHETREFAATIDPETTVERTVRLEPKWIDFRVKTLAGVSVSVVDEAGERTRLGATGEDGTLHVKEGLFAGKYTVALSKPGYREKRLPGQRLTAGEPTVARASLEPLPATLRIRSEPSGARVLLNGSPMGRTPVEVEAPAKQTVRVQLRREGFRPVEQRLTPAPNAEKTLDFGVLERKAGRIRLTVEARGETPPASVLDELRLAVGGRTLAAEPEVERELPPGEYRLAIRHPAYSAPSREVEIRDRETTEVEVDLKPLPAYVRLDMPDAFDPAIALNGRDVEAKQGRVEVPVDEEAAIRLRIPDHLTMTRRFELGPGETATWDVVPERIPGPERGSAWTVPYVGIDFAWIPAGETTLGSPSKQPGRLPNEGPRTKLVLTRGFWMSRTEITQAAYQAVTGENPASFRGEDKPVERVTWHEARAFCDALTRREREGERLPEGHVYRLPTEAEWEYAARGGASTPFWFGASANAEAGNFSGVYPRDSQSLVVPEDRYGTMPVGAFEANPFGLYDVHGNVREWTLDRYNGRLPGDRWVDPAPREEGRDIAARGGSWQTDAARARSAARTRFSPTTRSSAIGFRVVLAPER